MRPGSLLLLASCLLGTGCSSGGVGDRCADHGDCDSTLQCVQGTCVPRCQRAPECGDGFACDQDGICRAATGQPGDSCTSEVDCAAGLACELDSAATAGMLSASCVPESAGRPTAAECTADTDCRNGTCALGHCVDLCAETRDCPSGTSCTQIPRVEAGGAMFSGCLQSRGVVQWSIPVQMVQQQVYLPIPASAQSVSVTFRVDDPSQSVGVDELTSPSKQLLIDPVSHLDLVRHASSFAQSVLDMPVSPTLALEPGAYLMTVASHRGVLMGSAIPSVTASVKLDPSVLLDLHFYFLNLDDHPCAATFGPTFNADLAQTATSFQNDYLGQLRTIFAQGGVELGAITYEDLRSHPELDGLSTANAGALLALGAHDTGVNVFFVRTLSPVGVQAFAPNPGPARLAGTRQSGIVISVDTLCYRTWAQLARLTAHELARYMGLYDNIDILGVEDPIVDSDTSPSNLMFYSELGGTDLSAGQRAVLTRSVVLR